MGLLWRGTTAGEEAEAFAIAEEAQKTLQQARDAVQKARQARGYYPLGGKGSSPSGPASGKGRGKPSGKGLVDVRGIASSNALRGPRALESHLEKAMARKALKEKGPRAQKAKAPRPTSMSR